MFMEKTIKIKLVKSPIRYPQYQNDTLKALGLNKMNQVVTKVDNEAVRGMIRSVAHLVVVIE
jgi:large subunit ribosomal protein L30